MVFTGDLEEEGEDRLLQKSRLPEQITVLKAGHHGSATSSSQAFLEKLSPGAVLISCGEDNPYGHPHKEALERFRKAGSRIYLTAERGALTIRTDGKRVSIKPFLKP